MMCDSNRVKGTVKQYLVTDDNDIVVNDLGTFYIYPFLPPGGALESNDCLSIELKVENVIR